MEFDFYTEKDKDETVLTRIVIFEKCRKHDFESLGLKYWRDKNGEVVRIDDEYKTLDLNNFLGHKGKNFMDVGYVYAPYVLMYLTPEVIQDSLLQSVLNASNCISRYNNQVASANYIVCNPEISAILKELL